MSKIAVVFHSVCGNTYLMAKAYADYLKEQGEDVALFRVKDDTFEETSLRFESSRVYREEILKLPVVGSGKDLTDYDALFLGSPTYYGCVSAQMKAFMDSFCDIWVDALMSGKYFGCFATSGDLYGGSELCMQVMNAFAQHMGMINLSVPCNIGGAPQPAYGITWATGPMSDQRMTEDTVTAIRRYLDHVLPFIHSKA
ncbi:flavodoxin family protein [Massilimaliae timonensis]|uniref:Flavodoxin family protein n=1 Tax=Massiliimalia timonensis TaxID=1987501 RepID=A0A8J6P614_9FIRM|nr:flavodoxin family protein [Massiliimalia timonensis]MBC8611673.1 flavodoxin family protein [Massiliimalia timonensis]